MTETQSKTSAPLSPAAKEAQVIVRDCVLPSFREDTQMHVLIDTSHGVIRFLQRDQSRYASVTAAEPTYKNDCNDIVEIQQFGVFFTKNQKQLREDLEYIFTELISRMATAEYHRRRVVQ